jgi:hypothetical protein
MYFVLDQNVALTGEYAYFREPVDGSYEIGRFDTGEPLKAAPPVMTLESDPERGAPTSDLLLTDFTLFAFSEAARRVLEDLGVEEVEWHPVRIVPHATGKVDDSYRIANFTVAIDCLDLGQSDVTYASDSKDIMGIYDLVLDEERIAEWARRSGREVPKIFRVGEFRRTLLVDESVKERCEAEGLTGMSFIELDEYAS